MRNYEHCDTFTLMRFHSRSRCIYVSTTKRLRHSVSPLSFASRITSTILSIACASSSCIRDVIRSTVCSMSACNWSACLSNLFNKDWFMLSKALLNMLFRSMRLMLLNSSAAAVLESPFRNRSKWHVVVRGAVADDPASLVPALARAVVLQKMTTQTFTSPVGPLLPICCCPLSTYCTSSAPSKSCCNKHDGKCKSIDRGVGAARPNRPRVQCDEQRRRGREREREREKRRMK